MTDEEEPDVDESKIRDAVWIRDADDLVEFAVRETLDCLILQPEHAAAKKLAIEFARAIDRADSSTYSMRHLAPLLLDCLESLGATPRAKAALREGKPPSVTGGLTALRAARRA